MAAQLKHILNEEAVRWIADSLSLSYAPFQCDSFAGACLAGLDTLELTPRAWHIADAMYAHLPRSFAAAAEILVASLRSEIPPTGENGASPLRYMPHVFFVQKYGIEDFESAMHAQYELTKRFSAEFSIRAFLERYPKATYERLTMWTKDENVHVRRLVSEGTRPRLPWAARLKAFQKDPQPVVALLEILKDDPERYVQRSVANNVNDIGKDHPELAAEICRRWLVGASPARQWIVRHALRSLVKKGHKAALRTIGMDKAPMVEFHGARLSPPTVRLGGSLRFSFSITSTGKRSQDLLIDYAVHFMKANGTARPKVFKLRKISLAAGATATLEGTVSFADMTTRKHYPGTHRISALINGTELSLASFEVVP